MDMTTDTTTNTTTMMATERHGVTTERNGVLDNHDDYNDELYRRKHSIGLDNRDYSRCCSSFNLNFAHSLCT